MILEYAQLLSTTHRVLDGQQYIDKTANNRSIKRWALQDSREQLLYKATHVNHPSAVWTRGSVSNYLWLTDLLTKLCSEYTYRYGKVHKCQADGLVDFLARNVPSNISTNEFTQPTPAMPDKYKVVGDSITSYRQYYIGDKARMASWKNRTKPQWWNNETV
jgi:hypothetical protein